MTQQPEVPTPPATNGVGSPHVSVTTAVNGRQVHLTVPARLTLADLLRDHLGLTGTHLGCEHGVCGSCTVLLDGRSVRSCLVLAVQVHGRQVTTVEGLDQHPTTARLRTCFGRNHALQCGFCTPGMLVTATELVEEHPRGLTETVVRETMAGNLCRCTGYQGIVKAILEAGDADSSDVPPACSGRLDAQEDPE